jgi:hypothetical protein
VDVRAGDGALGGDDALDEDVLAVGLGGGAQEGELLAGDGVDEGLAGLDHVRLLSRERRGVAR